MTAKVAAPRSCVGYLRGMSAVEAIAKDLGISCEAVRHFGLAFDPAVANTGAGWRCADDCPAQAPSQPSGPKTLWPSSFNRSLVYNTSNASKACHAGGSTLYLVESFREARGRHSRLADLSRALSTRQPGWTPPNLRAGSCDRESPRRRPGTPSEVQGLSLVEMRILAGLPQSGAKTISGVLWWRGRGPRSAHSPRRRTVEMRLTTRRVPSNLAAWMVISPWQGRSRLCGADLNAVAE